MNILILGGTRFIGTHLVRHLIKSGHNITIATRGLTKDNYKNDVERIIIERTDPKSISKELSGKYFDAVYDSLAFSSNDIKYLLDSLKCNRYIETSSLSVYSKFKENIKESDFDPYNHPLKWCSRTDYTYDEIKRQAECAIFQVYNKIPSVAVRFPFVVGDDDYTKRLYFYVEHIIKSIPMYVDNVDERITFINSCEAGKFLAFLADSDFYGCINAASYGNISLKEIIGIVENRTGIKASYSNDGEKAPYNGVPTYSMNLQKSEELGFRFSHINSWIYDLINRYIDTLL